MAYGYGGHGGFGGGMNMNALMQQAKKMQEQMLKAQEELQSSPNSKCLHRNRTYIVKQHQLEAPTKYLQRL